MSYRTRSHLARRAIRQLRHHTYRLLGAAHAGPARGGIKVDKIVPLAYPRPFATGDDTQGFQAEMIDLERHS